MRQATNGDGSLRTSITGGEGCSLLSLDGRLTIDTSPHLRDQILAMLNETGLANLTLDLSNVPHMDCAGIATLLEALKIARSRKIQLQLTGLHDRPRYLLEVTGLVSLFATPSLNNSLAT
jgi:anti-anti-sigma factor